MDQTEPSGCEPRCRCSWIKWVVLFSLICTGVTFIYKNPDFSHKPNNLAPSHPPVSLEMVFIAEVKLKGEVHTTYSGIMHNTFRNSWPVPITMAFPPLCIYSYGEDFQDWPFPGKKEEFPEFAKKDTEVIIPPGESVSFTSGFTWGINRNQPPGLHRALVFGPPKTPCEYPVLGTIYGAVEFKESPEGVKEMN